LLAAGAEAPERNAPAEVQETCVPPMNEEELAISRPSASAQFKTA
jgi:hypothetical protein